MSYLNIYIYLEVSIKEIDVKKIDLGNFTLIIIFSTVNKF